MVFAITTAIVVFLILFLGATQVVIPLWNDEELFTIFKGEKQENINTEETQGENK